MNTENPLLSIEDSIFNENIKKLEIELTESVIDSILEEGLLKEIPIISTSISLYKLGRNYKLRNLIKNLYTFLFQLKGISEETKTNFLNKIEKNKDDLFEKLLYILDRLDDSYKSEIIGKLFRNYIYNKINLNDFLRMCFIVERTYYKDLKYFNYSYNPNNIDDDEDEEMLESKSSKDALVNMGLIEYEIKENEYQQKYIGASKRFEKYFTPSEIGRILLEYGF